MIKKTILVLMGMIYDILMFPITLLFIPSSFLTKKASDYRRNRLSVAAILKMQKKEHGSMLFYCSSVGEFEQAIPVIDRFEKGGDYVIILFHSKKGYDYCRSVSNYETHLTPFDFFLTWFLFLKKLNPSRIIINRHEFWIGFALCSARLSKLFIINYVVKKKIPFFDKLILPFCSKVYCVNGKNTNKFEVTGDTRVDRLKEKHKTQQELIKAQRTVIRKFLPAGAKLILIGNCYDEDLKLLLSTKDQLSDEFFFLIIPARKGLNSFLTNTLEQHSTLDSYAWTNKIILLNTVGNLFELYGSADIAWVGGGFSKGIHNCLEPSYYGIPLIAGPNLNQQPDAFNALDDGSLRIFDSEKHLRDLLENLKNKVIDQTEITNSLSPADETYSRLK